MGFLGHLIWPQMEIPRGSREFLRVSGFLRFLLFVNFIYSLFFTGLSNVLESFRGYRESPGRFNEVPGSFTERLLGNIRGISGVPRGFKGFSEPLKGV